MMVDIIVGMSLPSIAFGSSSTWAFWAVGKYLITRDRNPIA